MKIAIRKTDKRWTVNGKSLNEMSLAEKIFMDGFFRALKIDSEVYEDVTP